MASRLLTQRLASAISRPQIRTMASSAVRKYEFLVIVPDKPGVHEKRLEVRGQHFQNMVPRKDSGDWQMGGALLNSVPQDDDATKFDFMGSTVIIVAESKEAVVKQLEQDIYTTSGVWDVEKAQIYPFKCAFRAASK